MRGMVIEYSDSSIRKALKVDSISSKLYEEDGTTVKSLKGQARSGNIVKLSYDGNKCIIVPRHNNKVIDIFDIRSKSLLWRLKGHLSAITCLELNPVGQLLVSASYDNSIRTWDIVTGQCKKVLLGHTNTISSIALSPDGKIIASASYDNTIRIWDALDGRCLSVLEGHTGPVLSIVFTPDASRLISASYDNTIQIWDVATRKRLHVLKGHTGPVLSISISPDRKILASASTDKTIRIWNIANGQILKVLLGHTDWINMVTFLPYSPKCISSSYDNSIRLWDIGTGECIDVFDVSDIIVDSIAVSSDGKECIYISGDGSICSIDLSNREVSLILDVFEHSEDQDEEITNKAKDMSIEKIAYEGKVIYDGRKTDLSELYAKFLKNQTDTMDINVSSLFHKDDSWEDEKEYRFAFNYKHLLNHRLTNLTPTAIYLGYRMSEENVNRIYEYCKLKEIPLYKYTPAFHSNSSKKYVRSTIFDPDKESDFL